MGTCTTTLSTKGNIPAYFRIHWTTHFISEVKPVCIKLLQTTCFQQIFIIVISDAHSFSCVSMKSLKEKSSPMEKHNL